MPDHLHGIIVLGYHPAAHHHPKLGAVIGAFKSISTRAYGHGVAHRDWPPYNKQLWQTGYNDHIIRTDGSLERHRKYIEANPARWIAKRKSSLP
jgi:REP element-mobilizing transposase RayT